MVISNESDRKPGRSDVDVEKEDIKTGKEDRHWKKNENKKRTGELWGPMMWGLIGEIRKPGERGSKG